MDERLRELIECPFCGGELSVVGDPVRDQAGAVVHGVLSCSCCAYPVVDRIAVVRTSDEASAAIRAVEAGQPDEARLAFIDADVERKNAFEEWLAHPARHRFATAIDALQPDGEGIYYVLRFSDPTFLVADAVVRGLAQDPLTFDRPAIDVCGGCGHLTRVLVELAERRQGPPPVLADGSFWRLWVAKRFVAPSAHAVCCDANGPLPFRAGQFSLAVCNDAFHYVWTKRLLATELMRLTADAGVVALTHVHSALGENHTAGLTLEPSQYASLFEGRHVSTYLDSALLAARLEIRAAPLDLSARRLEGEASISLIISGREEIFRTHRLIPPRLRGGSLRFNPLYDIDRRDGRATLTLRFPTEDYAREFGGARQYLPPSLELDLALIDEPSRVLTERPELIERQVVLDLPADYL